MDLVSKNAHKSQVMALHSFKDIICGDLQAVADPGWGGGGGGGAKPPLLTLPNYIFIVKIANYEAENTAGPSNKVKRLCMSLSVVFLEMN